LHHAFSESFVAASRGQIIALEAPHGVQLRQITILLLGLLLLRLLLADVILRTLHLVFGASIVLAWEAQAFLLPLQVALFIVHRLLLLGLILIVLDSLHVVLLGTRGHHLGLNGIELFHPALLTGRSASLALVLSTAARLLLLHEVVSCPIRTVLLLEGLVVGLLLLILLLRWVQLLLVLAHKVAFFAQGTRTLIDLEVGHFVPDNVLADTAVVLGA